MEEPVALTVEHESGAVWQLRAGEVLRLCIGPGPRRLEVTEGCLWLTQDGTQDRPGRDLWIRAGEGVSLPSGARVLVDAHPGARFRLLVPPQACALAASRWAAAGRLAASLLDRLTRRPEATGAPLGQG